MVTSIVLVRHAASKKPEKEEPILPGPNITSTGKEQAKKTAKFLEGAKFSKVYSSPMLRAKETAEIISQEEKILSDELSEFNKIVFEEEPEHTDKFNENIEKAIKSKEYFEELLRKNRDSQILIVSHGNIIRFLTCHALKIKPHLAPNFFIDNASITQLFFDGNDLISVGCINSTAHLFLEEKTNWKYFFSWNNNF